MKAEDLMPCDWVNVFDTPKQIEGIRKFQNGDEVVYYDGDNGNFIENVTPIPLTPEILEKNGFVYDVNCEAWEQIPRDVYGIRYEDNTYLFSLGVFDPFSQDSDIAYHTIAEINYVHELQHALKLFGIKKEIILWKQ